MALVKDPLGRARKLRAGQLRDAAQLHANLEAELGLNPDLPPEWEDQADQAVKLLESRFGGGERLQELAVDRGITPSLSRKAQAATDDDGQADDAKPKPSNARPSGASRGGRADRRARPARRPSSRRRAGSRALAGTGLPGMASTGSGLALQLLGVTVGLVVLYVLVRPRGSGQAQTGAQAIAGAGNVFAGGLRAFLSLADPLAPRTTAAGAGAGGSSRPSTTVTGRPGSAGSTAGLAHGGPGAQTTTGQAGATSAPLFDLPHGAAAHTRTP